MNDKMTSQSNKQIDSFPLTQSKYATFIARGIVETATKIAQTNRGTLDPKGIVQHTENELRALFEIAAGFHDTNLLKGYILQCGTFCGGSACIMARALKESSSEFIPLVTVDNYTKKYSPLRKAFDQAYVECRENIWTNQLRDYVTLIISNDTSYLQTFWSSPIRIAFIDSSHHYEHTKQEIELIVPHLCPHGWLLFHDYFSETTPGVAKAVDEFLERTNKCFNCYRCDGLFILQLSQP